MTDLHLSIEKMQEIAERHCLEEARRQLRLLAERANNDKNIVIVLGKMKAGKSHFVNQLIGADNLLPTGVTRTTARMPELSYGLNESYWKHMVIKDDGLDRVQIQKAEFQALCSDAAVETTIKTIGKVSADLPLEYLRELGGIIVDAPGFESLLPSDTEWVLNYLPQADAVVYCVRIMDGLTQTDLTRIRQLAGERIDDLIVVLTQVDLMYAGAKAQADLARQLLTDSDLSRVPVMVIALPVDQPAEGLEEVKQQLMEIVKTRSPRAEKNRKLASAAGVAIVAALKSKCRQLEMTLTDHNAHMEALSQREAEEMSLFSTSLTTARDSALRRMPNLVEGAIEKASEQFYAEFRNMLNGMEVGSLKEFITTDECSRYLGTVSRGWAELGIREAANVFETRLSEELRGKIETKQMSDHSELSSSAIGEMITEWLPSDAAARKASDMLSMLRFPLIAWLSTHLGPLGPTLESWIEGVLVGIFSPSASDYRSALHNVFVKWKMKTIDSSIKFGADTIAGNYSEILSKATSLCAQASDIRSQVQSALSGRTSLEVERAQAITDLDAATDLTL